MKNSILVNGNEIISKCKKGRNSWLKLSSGEEIGSSSIYGKKIQIKCNECGKLVEVKFYGALFKKRYVCQTCGKKGNKNPFYGKRHTKDFKEKLSKERKRVWYTGKDNYWYNKNPWENYSDDQKKMLKLKHSNRQQGDKNSFYGKKHDNEAKKKIGKSSKQRLIDHPEYLKKMISCSLNKQRKGLKTSIERMVQVELEKRGLPYKYSKILHRKYQFDFIIGDDILLEVHGDFWHANPKFYGEGKKPLCAVQKIKIELDIRKKAYAEKYGYKLFYIWGDEVRRSDFEVIDVIVGGLKI